MREKKQIELEFGWESACWMDTRAQSGTPSSTFVGVQRYAVPADHDLGTE